MKKFGIDVSLWQRGIDFDKAKKDGVSFVIIKASEGQFSDPCFASHYEAAKKASLDIGAYHYLRATTAEEAEKEAEFFINTLSGREYAMPVFCDVEDPKLFETSPEHNAEIVKAFCDYCEKRGYWVGIYTYYDFLKYNLADAKLQKYAHWIAKIDTEKPAYSGMPGVFGMWQFGGDRNLIRSNIVGGVVCDQNYCYIDYPAKIKARKLNGFSAPFKEYFVKVQANPLVIRSGAGIGYDAVGEITDGGVYTIVAECDGSGASKWGKLKSGAGWINLDYTKKI